jgi:alpha-tubulin suppressor-like RCC1 family protein
MTPMIGFRGRSAALAVSVVTIATAAVTVVLTPAAAAPPSCIGIVQTAVFGWGHNGIGEVGDGTQISPRTSPNQTLGTQSNMKFIAAGDESSAAVTNCGNVETWGDNTGGQLGDGTTTYRLSPIAITGPTDVVKVAVGGYHMLALTSTGTVWSWGRNSHGQLGTGSLNDSFQPVQIVGLTGVTDISAGDAFSMAVKSDGTVWAWGEVGTGRLGLGIPSRRLTDRTRPTQIPGLTNVRSIACGVSHTLAVKFDGTVMAWGYNFYGQVGNGNTNTVYIPVAVAGLTGVTRVAAGIYHSVALKSDGSVWTWGGNDFFQLGRNVGAQSLTPGQVANTGTVTQIASGFKFVLILHSDGTVAGWGENDIAQLGVGNAVVTEYASPVQIQNFTNVVQIAAGYESGLALRRLS